MQAIYIKERKQSRAIDMANCLVLFGPENKREMHPKPKSCDLQVGQSCVISRNTIPESK